MSGLIADSSEIRRSLRLMARAALDTPEAMISWRYSGGPIVRIDTPDGDK